MTESETAKEFVERMRGVHAEGWDVMTDEEADRLFSLALKGAEMQCGDCSGVSEADYATLTECVKRQAAEIARLKAEMEGKVAIPIEDHRRLLEAAECDDRLIWCETCGAWMDHDDPACASTEDYTGCWKVAAGEEAKPDNCRSHRAPLPSPPKGD